MSGFMIFTLVLAVLAIVFAFQAIKVVPQQSAWIVERLGKFHAVLSPGLNVVIPSQRTIRSCLLTVCSFSRSPIQCAQVTARATM